MREQYIEHFLQSTRAKIEGVAKEKGYYSDNGDVGDITGVEHHIGEIIYKAIRYRAKKDPDDLIKVAAWALLIFVKRQEKDAKTG